MKLIAVKSFSYNTRRLNPGDTFEAKDPDGRLLIGVLKARKFEDRKEEVIPAPKKAVLDKLKRKPIAEIEPIIVTKTTEKEKEVVNDASSVSTDENSKTKEAPKETVAETTETSSPVNSPRRDRARKN